MAEYRNPQQEGGGGGDKRMLMVFAVTFALIIISQVFLFKKPTTQPNKPTAAETTQSSQPAPPAQAPPPAAQVSTSSKAGKAKAAEVSKAAGSEAETVVENSLYRIVFTNRGAEVKSWQLKKYKDEDGHPLDLVNKNAAKYGLPLSLYTYDEKLRNQINSALYVATPTGTLPLRPS